MKHYLLGLAALVAVVSAILFHASRRPAATPAAANDVTAHAPEAQASDPIKATEVAPESPSDKAPESPSASPVRDSEPKPRYARLTIRPGEPIPELHPFQAERDHLLNLAATQDPRQVPAVAASLSHPDASVRETARQALLQLGDASAIPALKAAADKTKSSEEATLLAEAAEFLSLPDLMDVIANPNPPASGLAAAPTP